VSVALDGVNQYLNLYVPLADGQGIPTQAPLGSLVGYPQWWMVDVKPDAIDSLRYLIDLTYYEQSSFTQHCSLVIQSGFFKRNASGFFGAEAPASIGVWQRVLLYMASRTSTIIYVNGVPGAEYTTDAPWPVNLNSLFVGARAQQSAISLYADGKLANLAFGMAPLSVAQRTGCKFGTDPASYPGCIRSCSLLANGNDAFGVFNFAAANSPTFDANDHPSIISPQAIVETDTFRATDDYNATTGQWVEFEVSNWPTFPANADPVGVYYRVSVEDSIKFSVECTTAVVNPTTQSVRAYVSRDNLALLSFGDTIKHRTEVVYGPAATNKATIRTGPVILQRVGA
jgi:hypothetical protein